MGTSCLSDTEPRLHRICIKVPTMNLSLLVLLSVFSLALSMPSNTETKEVEMRYGSRNRDCPIRNKTTKKRIVIPKECRALKGTWIGSWQKCGTTCTRMRDCQAWTFKSGWCSLYDDAQKKCGFTSVGGAGTTAGYSGCEA